MPQTPLRLALLLILLAPPARAQDNQLTDQEKQDGWLLLFDGKSMTGWQIGDDPIPPANVRDGAFNPHKMGGGRKLYVAHYAARQFGDFTLALDFKITPKCNSGVFLRVANPKDPVQSGFEIQIFDSAGKPEPTKHDAGALYDAQAPAANAAKPPGQWQHLEVTARGNTIRATLNGQPVLTAHLDRWTQAGKNPDGTKNKYKTPYKDMPKQGFIGLQDHLADCWFKNIKVKPLDPPK